MELEFCVDRFLYLSEKRLDLIWQELTAETVLPESLPEIGRILDTFGTVLVQSKTTETGSVRVTGGIQAGVLYLPEDGGQPEKIEVWLPFTVAKKIPTEDDTTLFYWGWIRSIETRFINSGKILVRACLGSELTLLTPAELKVARLEQHPEGLECKSNTYPMRLPLAAAEKELQIADEVLLEQSPGIEKLLKAVCSVQITESRCIGDKAVFKGDLLIRALYLTADGTLAVSSCRVPFSQYAELNREAEEGVVTVQPILRHMEIDTDGQPDSRRLLLNITALMQVVVRGAVPLRLTEDAYCLSGEWKPRWQTLELQPCLDIVQRDLTQNLNLPEEVSETVDVTTQTDWPENGTERPLRGSLRVNVLYFDREKNLKSRLLTQTFTAPDVGEIPEGTMFRLEQPEEAQQVGRVLRVPMRAELICLKKMSWQNLEGGEIIPGEQPEGPSLIVRTVSGDLWDLARDYRTTAAAIRSANRLDQDSLIQPRQILIPKGTPLNGAEEGRA